MSNNQVNPELLSTTTTESNSMLPPIDSSNLLDENDIPSTQNSTIDPYRRSSMIPTTHLPQLNPQPLKKLRNPYYVKTPIDVIPESDEFSSDQYKLSIKSNSTESIKPQSNLENEEEEEAFDQFILTHFSPFSSEENVVLWLNETEAKFNRFKFSRKQRFIAIPLLITGSVRLKYIKSRDEIKSFDDFYAYLLNQYEKNVVFTEQPRSTAYSSSSFPASSTYIEPSSEAPKSQSDSTFNRSHFSPHPPILRSTALGDLSDENKSNPTTQSYSDFERASSLSSLNNTTNDLRKAILESFVKTPKIFQGSKEDVNKWIEDVDHLFNLAHIPDVNKLDLISYALKGDALQWYKNTKQSLITWGIFVQEIKKAFTSSYQQELSFKKLESYCQGPHQSVRNYYNETLKLCTEADPTMTESTKLKHLLSKAKPTIQFEVRRKKPSTPSEFLDYAREVEELFQLSNLNLDNYSSLSSHQLSPRQPVSDGQSLSLESNSPAVTSSSSNSCSQSSTSKVNLSSHIQSSSSPNYQKPHPQHYVPRQTESTPYSQRPSIPPSSYSNFNRNNTRYYPNKSGSNYPTTNMRTASHIAPLMNLNTIPYPPTTSCHNRQSTLVWPKTNKSSLIFLRTFVNGQAMKLLIDTGTSTTFISKESLSRIQPSLSLLPKKSSFVLADGLAPFTTIGIVKLSILFADQITPIQAHVVSNLCSDLIIGMDYINRYSLNINITDQSLSINIKGKTFIMSIDRESSSPLIELLLPDHVKISRYSAIPITIPISSKDCSFIPHSDFQLNKSLIATMDLFQIHPRSTVLQLFNPYSSSHFIRKGTCLGYLIKPASTHDILPVICAIPSFGDATIFNGEMSESPNEVDLPLSLPNSSHSPTLLPLHLQKLTTHLNCHSQREQLSSLLSHFANIFDTSKHNISSTSISHVIRTIPHSPPASKPYPIPDKEEALYNIIQEFLDAKLISESNSPYAAPAILVKKSDGSNRLVVDYKKLNLITIKDSSPLPNMEEVLRKLGHGYQYFSKLDLKSGFYQIPIQEQDKPKTAFVTPFGLYHFNVLPMGLRNSPPTFQKVMTDALKSCRTFTLVYLDDIVVFSSSFDEHLIHLEQVFIALQAKTIVLNPPKCTLVTTQIDYLGHTVSSTFVKPNNEKIQAILDIPEPKTLAQANKFLGALSWYRKFLPNFATVAAPIHAITNLPKSLRHKFKWSSIHSESFHQLRHLLTSTPLFLHFPVNEHPLILTTDASNVGLGGVLQQQINGEIHNLCYHSQLLSSCQRKYSTIEKEALAILKCFDRMRPYLLGRNIILMTDHCPLCNIMKKTVHNNRVDRISTLIQEFNIIQVLHIKGRENCLPDFLSRYPHENNDELLDIDYGLASKSSSSSNHKPPPPSDPIPIAAMTLRPRPVSQQSHTPFNQVESESSESHSSQSSPPSSFIDRTFNYFDRSRIQTEQSIDPHIQQIITHLKNNPLHSSFTLKNKILYKLLSPFNRSKTKAAVIYLPSTLVPSLLQAMHDDPLMGSHFSTDRMLQKIRLHFWWPNMRSSIDEYVRSCLLCKQYNINRRKPHGHLSPIPPPPGPFQVLGIDFCGPFQSTPHGNKYVLVITDYYTRYVVAIPLPNCTADTTALTLFNDFFCKFGIPNTILSDQGSHFSNHLMRNLQQLIGYHHIYSSTYHPQSNGLTERFNATFVPQIAKLQNVNHNNWDEFLPAVTFAYNTGIHRTTQYSPYELLFGRRARLPIQTHPSTFSFPHPNDYFAHLTKCLKIYSKYATENILHQQSQSKLRYDVNRCDSPLSIGAKVLVKIHGLQGKLNPKFSSTTHTVIHSKHPTYVVRNDHTAVESTIHISNLRPLLIR